MDIIPFNIDAHFDALGVMLKLRNHSVPERDSIPRTGFLAIKDGTCIAMGFIRLVEGGYGQLDGLTTNPEASSQARHEAIDQVVDNIIEKAKSMGLKALVATTKYENILMRSLKHGFVQQPLAVISLDLSNAKGASQ